MLRGITIKRPLIPAAMAYLVGNLLGIYHGSIFISAFFILASVALFIIISRFKSKSIFLTKLAPYYFILAFFSFALVRSSISSLRYGEIENIFLYHCESENRVTIYGEVIGVRNSLKIDNEEIRHQFNLKNVSFLSHGKKFRLSGNIFVNFYCNNEENKGFIPQKGMLLETSGFLKLGRFGDKRNIRVEDVYLNTHDRTTKLISDKGSSGNILTRFRDNAATELSAGIEHHPEERDLLLAMVLGLRADLSDELLDIFKKAGTIHIFAISGLHVGAIALIIVAVLAIFGVSRKLVVLPLTPLLASYVYITGMQPSATRAGLMVIIYYSALIIKRKPDIFNSLALTLIILLVINPFSIVELGLILSLSMVLGIILFTAKIEKIFLFLCNDERAMNERHAAILAENNGDKNARVIRWPRDGLIVLRHFFIVIFASAFSAALVSFPLTAYFFGTLTPYSILANTIVVPLALPVMIFAGMGLFFSTLFPPIAPYSNLLAAFLTHIMKTISHWVASLPGASHNADFPLWALALWYITLFLLLGRNKKQ